MLYVPLALSQWQIRWWGNPCIKMYTMIYNTNWLLSPTPSFTVIQSITFAWKCILRRKTWVLPVRTFRKQSNINIKLRLRKHVVYNVIYSINTLRPKQNRRHFADDILKCIFLNENEWISLKISLKLVLKGPINNIPALVRIMAWRRPSDKRLSEPMMVSLPTHICVT